MAETSRGTGRRRKPNWTSLPEDLTAAILSRLGSIHMIDSAQMVCMKWRRISKNPRFWHKIDMRKDEQTDEDCEYDEMLRHLLALGGGHVVDVNIEGIEYMLSDIVRSACPIRRLRLFSLREYHDCDYEPLSQLRFLEELEISLCSDFSTEAIRGVGRSCPLLRTFKLNKEWCKFAGEPDPDVFYYGPEPDDFDDYPFNVNRNYDDDDDDVAEIDPRFLLQTREDADAECIAETMHGLYHLQLYGNRLTDNGLTKILDSCPHLELLDLRCCFNLEMGIELQTRCAERIKKLWLPHDSTKGIGFTSRSEGCCFRWLELPDNITASILSRLDTIDKLKSARKVCSKWRKICKGMKWETINMCSKSAPRTPSYLNKILRYVADRSCGNLVDVNVEDFIIDQQLIYMIYRSRGIRRLRLVSSYNISDEALIKVAPWLSLLEDLDITMCVKVTHKSLKVLGKCCPLLKSFKFNRTWHQYPRNDDAFAVAETMPGLHHLQLFGNQLNNDGLLAILDGCPHLESLDLRHCFNLKLEGDLLRKCTEQIKELLLPKDSVAGYEYIQRSPDSPDERPLGWSPWDQFDDF